MHTFIGLFIESFIELFIYWVYSLFSDATVYVGGLDEKVSEPLLWELFLQAGPVVNTHMPKDRVTGQHQGESQKFCGSEDTLKEVLFFSIISFI